MANTKAQWCHPLGFVSRHIQSLDLSIEADAIAAGGLGEIHLLVGPRNEFLLGEQFEQQVEGMDWRQQCQQMDSPQLGRTEFAATATTAGPPTKIVDELVGDMGCELGKQSRGASGRE